jgi:hypothetical protein
MHSQPQPLLHTGNIMSRGYGKLERMILAAVEERDAFPLMDLAPPPYIREYTQNRIRALRRAASNLINKGLVDFWYDDSVVGAYIRQSGARTTRRPHRLMIARPGYLRRKAVAQRYNVSL